VSRLGRKPKGAELVTNLDGSETARRRLHQIVQALAGKTSVPEACAELGVGESRFHQLRQEALSGALAALEPRETGRPRRPSVPGAARIAELEAELRELRWELQACHIREDLVDVLPRRAAAVKKTTSRPPTRRRPAKRGPPVTSAPPSSSTPPSSTREAPPC